MNMAVVAVLVLVVFFPRPAQAYIDPASGSVVISAIISAIVAVTVAIRTYWAKIKRRLKSDDSKEEPKASSND